MRLKCIVIRFDEVGVKIARPRLFERGYSNHFDYNTNFAAYFEYSVSDEENFSGYDGYSRANLHDRECEY